MAGLTDEDIQNELREIQFKINAKTDESLESTRRMVQLGEESKDAGIRTLDTLDKQGEQLDRIREDMDQINQDMRDAEKNLEGLEKCCGLCVLPWKRSKNFEKSGDYAKAWKKDEDGKIGIDGPRMVVSGKNQLPQGGYIKRITNDPREDEMEGNLVQVSGIVVNLRNMAIDMSKQIEAQNEQLDKITVQTDANKARIDEASKRAKKLLKE